MLLRRTTLSRNALVPYLSKYSEPSYYHKYFAISTKSQHRRHMCNGGAKATQLLTEARYPAMILEKLNPDKLLDSVGLIRFQTPHLGPLACLGRFVPCNSYGWIYVSDLTCMSVATDKPHISANSPLEFQFLLYKPSLPLIKVEVSPT